MNDIRRRIDRLSWEGKFKSVGNLTSYFALSKSWQNLVSYWYDLRVTRRDEGSLLSKVPDYDIDMTPATFFCLSEPYTERPLASKAQMKARGIHQKIAERIKKEFYERK